MKMKERKMHESQHTKEGPEQASAFSQAPLSFFVVYFLLSGHRHKMKSQIAISSFQTDTEIKISSLVPEDLKDLSPHVFHLKNFIFRGIKNSTSFIYLLARI